MACISVSVQADLLPHADEYNPGDPIVQEVRRISGDISRKMGVSLSRPIVVIGDYTQESLPSPPGVEHSITLAVAAPMQPVEDYARPGHRKWVMGGRPRTDTCVLGISIDLKSLSPLLRTVYLAHEIMHCFQFSLLTLEGLAEMPPWILEGAAQFAGEDHGGVGSWANNEYWGAYLNEQKPLFDRAYDAMGFFFYLKDRGIDPYPHIKTAILSSPASSEAMQNIRADTGNGVFSRWPTSLARRSDLGPEWNFSAPGITAARREMTSGVVTEGSSFEAQTNAAEQKLIILAYPAGKVLRLNIEGYGGIYWNPDRPGGYTELYTVSHEGQYCVQGTCQCPDGSLPSGITEVSGAGSGMTSTLVAISGAESSARLSASVETPQCRESTGSCLSVFLNNEERTKLESTSCGDLEVSIPPCMVGFWQYDSSKYEANLKEILPTSMRVISAVNNTTMAISDDGVVKSCIDFSTHTRMERGMVLETYTKALGSSTSKIGMRTPSAVCDTTIKEEIEAFAETNIGGVKNRMSIKIGGVFEAESQITCDGNELVIITPAKGVGNVTSRYLRQQE